MEIAHSFCRTPEFCLPEACDVLNSGFHSLEVRLRQIRLFRRNVMITMPGGYSEMST